MLVSVAAALLLLAASLQEAEAKPQNNYNQYYSEYNNQDYSDNYAGNYDQQVNGLNQTECLILTFQQI